MIICKKKWQIIHSYLYKFSIFQHELQHEIKNNVVYVTSKGSDQPAHTRSLIRAFASRLNILGVLSNWLNII